MLAITFCFLIFHLRAFTQWSPFFHTILRPVHIVSHELPYSYIIISSICQPSLITSLDALQINHGNMGFSGLCPSMLSHIFKAHHPSFFNQSTAQIDSDSTGPWPSLETIDKGPKFTDRGAHCNCSRARSWWPMWPLFSRKCPPCSLRRLPRSCHQPRWAVTQSDRWMAAMIVRPFHHPGPLMSTGT